MRPPRSSKNFASPDYQACSAYVFRRGVRSLDSPDVASHQVSSRIVYQSIQQHASSRQVASTKEAPIAHFELEPTVNYRSAAVMPRIPRVSP